MAAFDDIEDDPDFGVAQPEPPPPGSLWLALRGWWRSVCGPKQADE